MERLHGLPHDGSRVPVWAAERQLFAEDEIKDHTWHSQADHRSAEKKNGKTTVQNRGETNDRSQGE